jgi:hypothetical protein
VDETPTSSLSGAIPIKKKKAAGVCALRPLKFTLCLTNRQQAHYDKELFHFRWKQSIESSTSDFLLAGRIRPS